MKKESICIREMAIYDYPEVYEMWNSTLGVGLSDADSKEAIERYLERNPGLSYICRKNDKIIGSVLCGHDGRRGYIYHTCVLPEYRGQGIGGELVGKALEGLKNQGIDKCHIFVFSDNDAGREFWSKLDWKKRSDLLIYSKAI